MSTKYRDAISLRILVLEWCNRKTVLCLDTMSASNKLFSKTNLCLLRFGEEWNSTSSIFTNCLDFWDYKFNANESDFWAFRIVSIEIIPGARNLVVWAKSVLDMVVEWIQLIPNEVSWQFFLHCLGRMRPGLLNKVGGNLTFFSPKVAGLFLMFRFPNFALDSGFFLFGSWCWQWFQF